MNQIHYFKSKETVPLNRAWDQEKAMVISPQVMRRSMTMLHSASEHEVPIVEDNDEMADQLRTLMTAFEALKLEREADRLLIDKLEGRVAELEQQVKFWYQGVVSMTEFGTKLIKQSSEPPKKDATNKVSHPPKDQTVPQRPVAPAAVAPAATPKSSPAVTPVASPRSNPSAEESPQTPASPASPVSPKRERTPVQGPEPRLTRSKSKMRLNF